MHRTGIEISIPVKIVGAIHFWIERDEWEEMTPEQRKERLDDHVTAAAIRCDDDCIRVTADTTISASIIEPQRGAADLAQVEIYDPEA